MPANESSRTGEKYIQPHIPMSMITDELEGLYGADVLREMQQLLRFYDIYDNGQEVVTEGTNGAYVPATLRSRLPASIIDKEARFLFAKMPDIRVVDPESSVGKKNEQTVTDINNLLKRVFHKTRLHSKLLQAAKDCFIGRRVAVILNYNDEGIGIQFSPSLEFIYDIDPIQPDKLTKIVTFYMIKDSQQRNQQQIYKKKYWIESDGQCWVQEALYDGLGNVIEDTLPATRTELDFIPAFVIINDGLTGDTQGVSEIEKLSDSDNWFCRLNNADIDALRKSMNPVRYAVDMDPGSTHNLSTAAGAFWDLHTDNNAATDNTRGSVGILESSMGYSTPLGETIKRLRMDMLEQVDLPDTRTIDLKVASGKALKSVYWGLIVRCDEKMLAWKPALEFITNAVIKGAIAYPNSMSTYNVSFSAPTFEYEVFVDNQYPLPEDEEIEKNVDMAEVAAQVMSRKSYMIKWRGLTEEQVQEELNQIRAEQEMLENSAMLPPDDFNENSPDEEQVPEGDK